MSDESTKPTTPADASDEQSVATSAQGEETAEAPAAPVKPAGERLIVVTGVTNGIGREILRQLAAKGCAVVGVARDAERGKAAVAEVVAATENERVELEVADLSLMSEVRALGQRLSTRKLDGLINNAGVKLPARTVTGEGIETTLAVNHLAPYLLSTLLRDALARDGGGRIVNVSSFMHQRAGDSLDDLQAEQSYSEDAVYSRSKFINLLTMYQQARDWEAEKVTVNAYNPGWVRTNMTAGGAKGAAAKFLAKSATLGAEGAVFLAVSPRVEAVTGAYYLATGRMKSSSAATYDEELQAKATELTENLLSAGVPA